MNAAELFMRCLENEEVERIFGLPGEENLDMMDVVLDSGVDFVTTRHEQGAAFMADVYGRLTGRAGVCLATLGPGATNLVTGVADANMDRSPVVAVAGQAATTRMHKESHQHLDLVDLFRPVSKYAAQLRDPSVVPEAVRKAFKVAEAEKPGVSFLEFPEDVAAADASAKEPLRVQSAPTAEPAERKVRQAAELIDEARRPVVLAGNGVIRAGASDSLMAFAERLNVPVAQTFMANGAMPFSHPLGLGTVGLQAHDYVSCGFDRADVIICVGYDMVEYPPALWNPEKRAKLLHVDRTPAEVDEHYILEAGVIGDVGTSLDRIAELAEPTESSGIVELRRFIEAEHEEHADDPAFPMVPQRILHDVRQVLDPEDIVVSDVGAHKMWTARMYQAERPNTCIISNGFASMGIGLPGAIAAKLVHPDRTALTVTGDAGFLMNCQELETALRVGTPLVALVWNDSEYGLIRWHQERRFGRASHIDFQNPDLVDFARSFGAEGYRVEAADELVPILEQAIADDTVVVVDCPVDYSENMKLTEKLGELVCPI